MSRYSNFVPRLISIKREHSHACNSNVFAQVTTEITDTSYDPNYLVSEIRQQQKNLSDDKIREGITVSNKVTDRPALVERVLQMYSGGMHAKDIAAQIGITPKSVSKLLHDNGARIRHSTEYSVR